MASKHVLKFSSINEFFENDNKTIRKGENAFESSHVLKMNFDADLLLIKGTVQASMKDKAYNVEINLKKSGEITSASCLCPKGIKCHHIAALAIFGHYNISVTDQECSWNAPKHKQMEAKTSGQLYPCREYSAIDRQLTNEELTELTDKLSKFGNTVGFTWLLQPEYPSEDQSDLHIMEDILSSAEFSEASDKNQYLKSKCCINDEDIVLIAKKTTGQGKNDKWLMVRKHRLTASNFGMVLSAYKRNKYPESLFKTLMGSYNLEGEKSIQWGKNNEENGVKFLKSQYQVNIKPTGIWLTNSGVLGASPDGLINTDTIIEIKCPYTYRNDKLSEKFKNDKNYIISFDDSGEIQINRNHNYYHQIQGGLYITKRQKCLLCIWSVQETFVVPIERDLSWAVNLEVLEKFFYNQYLPRLLKL